ncbi:TDT family transporter [Lacticaseibacillus daqingensis]|uniref:TDT family transporter n=1 Tax=Lacticaseibacillus daqingensis TaxID=2486014 RepID=UPI000F775953|nr:TDT family transporter [Lacticaseibacillus daqingensis]
MKIFLTRLPLPVCGLMLGLASLGSLNGALGLTPLWALCEGVALGLWGLVILKCLLVPRSALAALADPVVTSILPNLTMATMILAVFFTQLGVPLPVTTGLWWLAVIGHYAIMGGFFWRHLWRAPKRLAMVMPSWFVTFVGIGVIPVTCAPFAPALGPATTWLALVLYAGVFPVVIWRLIRLPLPTPALPLTTILAAPASLCLAAYLTVTPQPNAVFAGGLFAFCQLLYVIALIRVVPYFAHDFVPSMGAFTFPLAITATAIAKYTAVFAPTQPVLQAVKWLEWTVITAVVLMVTVRYTRFLIQAWPQRVPTTH